VDALADPARRLRAALWLALAYALVWFLYGTIAKSSQGMYVDMAEMLVWMHEPSLGYPEHPPFLAWELTAWFAVFPIADWSYYLFSAVNLGAGLFAAFVLAGEWLDGEKRAAVPFLLAVIPFYNFLGLRFDQNTGAIPIWAVTTWAFMRSLDTRATPYAVLTGLLAASCMLTKYWSGFLLLGIGLAALLDRRRDAYFRSPAPYISAALAALALTPHVLWLIREHFPPMTWVTTRRASGSVFDWLRSLSEYSFGTLGYVSVAIALVAIFVRPSWRGARDGLFPSDPDRRTAAILFWAPLLIPIPVAIATRTNLLSLWNAQALALLPVVLLGSPLVTVTRDQVARIAMVPIAAALLALLASPIVALATFRNGVENYAVYTRPLAAALDRQWKQGSERPLKLIAGPFPIASSIAMYVPDRPSTFGNFSSYLSPWATPERIAHQGIAIVCPRTDSGCIAQMDALIAGAGAAAGVRKTDVAITPRWLGFEGPSQTFVIAIVPPQP